MTHHHSPKAYINAILSALGRQDYNRASVILNELQVQAPSDPLSRTWMAYLAAVILSERDNNWIEAEQTLTALRREELTTELHLRVVFALSRVYEQQHFWDKAVESYEDTFAIAKQEGQSADQARALRGVASTYYQGFRHDYYDRSKLLSAIATYRQALALLSVEGTKPPDQVWLEGAIWSGLGQAYEALYVWQEAAHCFMQEIRLSREVGDEYGRAIAILNLGITYEYQGQLQTAKSLFNDALVVALSYGDQGFENQITTRLEGINRALEEEQSPIEAREEVTPSEQRQLLEDVRIITGLLKNETEDNEVAIFRNLLAHSGLHRAEVLRRCAVPRLLSANILAVLRGQATGNQQIIEEMSLYGAVKGLGESYYAYHEDVRTFLLQDWRTRRPAELSVIHKRLAVFYEAYLPFSDDKNYRVAGRYALQTRLRWYNE